MRSKKGFTLMEMLIVVAIIAVLLAISIPAFGKSLNKAKEASCAANRRTITTMLYTKLIFDEIKIENLDAEMQKLNIKCPSDGKLTIEYVDELELLTVHCSKHTETYTQNTLSWFEQIMEHYKDYGIEDKDKRNDIFRKALFNKLNGKWHEIKFEGDNNTHYIQPFFGETYKKVYVYANTSNVETGSWGTSYLYNPENNTWYKYTKGKNIQMTDTKKENWEPNWDTDWTPVDVIEELE